MAKKNKVSIKPKAAAAWFLHDMAEVSGYAIAGFTEDTMLSIYATYRPMLTAPDPWYFAGVVALEACKICDLFEPAQANEVLREVFDQMDGIVGRDDDDVSTFAFLIMGRLGLGSLLLHRKVPDNLLAKVMLILVGSQSASSPIMPDPTAHKQLRAALKLGMPVWWKMFERRYTLTENPLDTVMSDDLVAYADQQAAEEQSGPNAPLLLRNILLPAVEAQAVPEAQPAP